MNKNSTAYVRTILAGLTLVAAYAVTAQGGYAYDEAIDGELPHPNAAFVLPFGTPAPNTVRLTVTNQDSDGWILQVDPGETLKSFTLTSCTPSNPLYTATFHMYDGPTQADPVLGTPYSSFGSELLGVDFLEHYAIGPLGEGQYLFDFWHDNTNGPTMRFDINMTGLSPVEEGTWAAIKQMYR